MALWGDLNREEATQLVLLICQLPAPTTVIGLANCLAERVNQGHAVSLPVHISLLRVDSASQSEDSPPGNGHLLYLDPVASGFYW